MNIKEIIEIQNNIDSLTKKLKTFVLPYLKAYYKEVHENTIEHDFGEDVKIISINVSDDNYIDLTIESELNWDIINIPFSFIEDLNK